MTLFQKVIIACCSRSILKSTVKRLNESRNYIQAIIDEKTERKNKANAVLEVKPKEVVVKDVELIPVEPEPLILTDEIREFLLKSDIAEEDIRITFIMPSRIKNNVTFNLAKLLDSSLANSDDPKRTEFILIIDEDDDIARYVELKKTYGDKLPLKIIISPQRYSYFYFQKYWKMAFDYMSPFSKMFLICSDDIYMNQKGFDSELLKADQKFKDNVYVIHTMILPKTKLFGRNHEANIKIHNQYKTSFCAFSADGVPTSYYVFLSRAFYEEGKKLQEQGVVGDEWTYVANCVAVDWYASMLGDFISDLGLEDRVVFLDNLIMRDMRTVADHHIKSDAYGFQEYKYAYQAIFEHSTIEHLRRIAASAKNRVMLNN